jgi:hypothetical protein
MILLQMYHTWNAIFVLRPLGQFQPSSEAAQCHFAKNPDREGEIAEEKTRQCCIAFGAITVFQLRIPSKASEKAATQTRGVP